MSISDELAKLQGLYKDGALTDAEFGDAKLKVIGGAGAPYATADNPASSDKLDVVTQLERLDHAWRSEREQYCGGGPWGTDSIPSVVQSILWGFFIGCNGLFFVIVSHAHKPHFRLGTLIGIVFIVMAIYTAISGCIKASNYRAPHERYQSLRDDLIAKLGAA